MVLLAVLFLGGPLFYSFASSALDGHTRYAETPFRSVLGEDVYEALMAGRETPMHYLGNNRRVPDFELQDRNGGTWRMSEHRGKVVVLNFWSITCRPCIEEMPTLEQLAHMAEEWPDVEIVAVSTDAGWDAVQTILPEQPRLTHLFDPDKAVVGEVFGTRLYPETWIIDGDGVIRFRYDGPLDWSNPVVIDVIDAYR